MKLSRPKSGLRKRKSFPLVLLHLDEEKGNLKNKCLRTRSILVVASSFSFSLLRAAFFCVDKKVLRDLCRQKKSCHEQKGAPETFLTEQILIRHLKLFFPSFSLFPSSPHLNEEKAFLLPSFGCIKKLISSRQKFLSCFVYCEKVFWDSFLFSGLTEEGRKISFHLFKFNLHDSCQTLCVSLKWNWILSAGAGAFRRNGKVGKLIFCLRGGLKFFPVQLHSAELFRTRRVADVLCNARCLQKVFGKTHNVSWHRPIE